MKILDWIVTVLWLIFWMALAVTMARAEEGVWTAQPGATEALNPRCRESAFTYSRLLAGRISCNLPDDNHTLAALAETAKRFCGTGDPANWPGFTEGAEVMWKELDFDQAGACARLAARP